MVGPLPLVPLTYTRYGVDHITQTGQTIILIHLMHGGRVACMSGLTEMHETTGHPTIQRTDDPRAVTCPMCKRSSVFLSERSKYG